MSRHDFLLKIEAEMKATTPEARADLKKLGEQISDAWWAKWWAKRQAKAAQL